MDNAEEIMQCLEEFSKMKPKDIPHELDDYLGYVAKTGDPVFKWSIVKCLFREKLLNVITNFYETTLSVTELPPCPNVDPFNYERMKANLLEKLDSFHGAPFTVQRISELLTNPRREYNRADKFMRAIEKNILVVSTREPGRLAEGECENDPSYNGIPDANDSGVETGFPCNDLVDSEATPQAFEASTENIEHAYNLNIDTSGTPVLPGASQEEPFIATPSEPQEGMDVPSTSGETKVAETTVADNKENESVICSTATPTAVEQTTDDALPMSSTTDIPSQIQEPALIDSTAVPSTSEAVPVKEIVVEPVPSTSTSNIEMEGKEEEEASSSQEETEKPNIQPQVQEVEAAPSQEAIPAEEPSSSGSENLVSFAENSEEEVLVVCSNDEVELECKEAASVIDGGSECDVNPVPETTHEPSEVVEPSVEQEKVEEPMEAPPVEQAGDVVSTDEAEVTSCADSTVESKPEVEGSGDQTRETSVIHTTSPDEPMDVDECQTSSSDQSLP